MQSIENVLHALSSGMERNLATVDLSLLGATEALQEPGLSQISAALRDRILFDRSLSVDFLGAMLVLDKDGDVLFLSQSMPQAPGNFSDREYFRILKADPQITHYLSKPFLSRIQHGDPVVVLCRRVNGPDGAFNGAVIAVIRISYFQSLFEGVDLGSGGLIALTRTDGTILYRRPSTDGAGNIGVNRGDTVQFKKALASNGGPYVQRGALDGVERLLVSAPVGDFGLILTVGEPLSVLFEEWNRRALVTGAITLSICLMLAVTVRALATALRRSEEMEEEFEKLAVTDALTGLSNRRAIDLVLDTEFRRARRERTSLCVLMIDIDHFKSVNDRLGHDAGDEVLRRIGHLLPQLVRRPGDFVGRFGGEEFIALLPSISIEGARHVAERIRTGVEQMSHATSGPPLTVTVSIGIAAADGGDTPDSVVHRADEALYRAKSEGRNRVANATLAVA
ncbi:sensor domain-containing diguanylate cyclase [Xanthobacter autotrophicus DSM 431]|uniref:sensor domain-containing diguanylate cyclase n=1 Tax=Xanthobacter nonsaccharivorans TaxID=3119912 RepID=UPI003727F55B